MCGIVGIVGRIEAVPVLLEGLKRLEYRGYDSAGVAVLEDEGLTLRKRMGKLTNLDQSLDKEPVRGLSGIGHTRWATHGKPSETNCHPHIDFQHSLALVHNGVIENYQEIKADLAKAGVECVSETDTEVLTHLVGSEVAKADDFLTGLCSALKQARGAYALGILSKNENGVLYAARKGSPLVIGIGDEGMLIGSDVTAIHNHVHHVIYLENEQVARLTPEGVEVFDLDGRVQHAEHVQAEEIEPDADKAGFETFMLKEMHEQPRVLRGLLDKHLTAAGKVVLPELNMSEERIRSLDRVMIVSCGTAYYAAMYGRLLIEQYTTIAVETDLGSEFRYRSPKIDPDTLVIAVSQSGETADTLESVRMAKDVGCQIMAVCNVPQTNLVREADHVLYTCAGQEKAVASTKAFTAQLMAFILFTLHIAKVRGDISDEDEKTFLDKLRDLPNDMHYVLGREKQIAPIAEKHCEGPSALYLGRRFNYPIALEGALKNKEISYQHAEGYAAGEMKHGPIALINHYLPVVCICTDTEDQVVEKMITNAEEVKSRSGRIIALVSDGDTRMNGIAEDIIPVPHTLEALSPLVNVAALQMLAYHAAKARGTDIDQPRNLAKAVTVE